MPSINPYIFKNFDIRGTYPKDINEEVATTLARGMVNLWNPKIVSIGRDCRNSSPEIYQGILNGFLETGVEVVELGTITTEMHWFASGKYKYDLSLMVTASHNPPEWNGIKIAKAGANAISGDSGIYELRDYIEKNIDELQRNGTVNKKDILPDWKHHTLEFIEIPITGSKKFAVDAGNGVAGNIFAKVVDGLDLKYTSLSFNEDGDFPDRGPNPGKSGALENLKNEISKSDLDFGIAFDGDGDRIMLVNEKGEIYSGSVLHAFLASLMLKKYPGEIVLYTSCSSIIVSETIAKYGGKPVRVKVGHSLIKQKMREMNAVFAGEHSGHYYYRDNYFADSGLITALLVIEHLSQDSRKVSEILKEFNTHFSSGEINIDVKERESVVTKVLKDFTDSKYKDDFDGATVYYNDWWFNVRESSVEPVIHLLVEADDKYILEQKIKEVRSYIQTL